MLNDLGTPLASGTVAQQPALTAQQAVGFPFKAVGPFAASAPQHIYQFQVTG